MIAAGVFSPDYAQAGESPETSIVQMDSETPSEPAVPSPESRAHVGGFFHSRLNVDTSHDNPQKSDYGLRNGIFLKGDFDPGSRLRWTLSARASYKVFADEVGYFTNYYDLELFEAYAEITLGKLDLKLGKQVARWGRADISPTDNLNPPDLRDFIFTEKEFTKVPVPMARARYYLGDFNVEGVYVPFFQPVRLPPAGDNWSLINPRFVHDYLQKHPLDNMPQTIREAFADIQNGSLSIENNKFPQTLPKNGEGGFRVSGSGAGMDFSLSYLYTWQDLYLPAFSPDFILYIRNHMAACGPQDPDCRNAEEILLNTDPEMLVKTPPVFYFSTSRTHILGADVSTNVHGFGIRAETALWEKFSFLNEDYSITRKPFLEFSLGADRLFDGRYYVNFQILENLVLDWNRKTINPVNGAPIGLYVAKESMPSLVFFLRGLFGDESQYQPELRASYNLAFHDYLIDVLLNYSLTDSMNLALGAAFLNGPQHSIFGYFSQNDCVYLNFRYSF
ncbi:MAG: hypothetical protein PHE84_08105 [bacterium]|nr:hypothetical protein [bacterium]